jgi:hypothetical protein
MLFTSRQRISVGTPTSYAFILIALVLAVHASPATHWKRADPPNSDWPIQYGFVAFGDSFAAGTGTGTGIPSSGKCRVGSSNFGDLLREYTNDSNVYFQSEVCAGATTKGLDAQIDAWAIPRTSDLATVSIGRNDIGFNDIIYWCILTPVPDYLNLTSDAECEEAKVRANMFMEDTGADGLQARLKDSFLRMIKKSEVPVSDPSFPRGRMVGCLSSSADFFLDISHLCHGVSWLLQFRQP